VTLQLLVLQLNAGIGRALVREAQLQRENAAESIENSELASGERVEAQAARLGMQLVPIGALRFLGSDPQADVARAAAALDAHRAFQMTLPAHSFAHFAAQTSGVDDRGVQRNAGLGFERALVWSCRSRSPGKNLYNRLSL